MKHMAKEKVGTSSTNKLTRRAHCKITTLTRTLTLTFDKNCSLFKWKLELMKVMHCLNRSWMRDIYHGLLTE